MWLSQQLSHSGGKSGGVSTGRVTIAGDKTAVMLQGERRELPLACPGGIVWAPAAGDDVLVLCSEEGERYVMGLAAKEGAAALPGEMLLRCGGAALKVGKNGVEIEGKVSISGQLILNGTDVGAALSALGL